MIVPTYFMKVGNKNIIPWTSSKNLTIVSLFKAGNAPSKTNTGFILKYNSLQSR